MNFYFSQSNPAPELIFLILFTVNFHSNSIPLRIKARFQENFESKSGDRYFRISETQGYL